MNITAQMPMARAQELVDVYEKQVDKSSAPTLNTFVNLLLESGLKSFQEYYLEINKPQPRDIEVAKQLDLPLEGL